jgi:hypothetical protein
MPEYDNTNKGVLFNEKEIKSDKHPTMTGKLDVEGKEYRIAAWEKSSKDSYTTFLTLAISEPKKPEQQGFEKARAVADKIKAKQDVVHDVDTPINLEDIPF